MIGGRPDDMASIYGLSDTWRLPDGAVLHAHRLGDETAVYVAGSGNTHIVDNVTATILQRLRTGPASTLSLYQYVAGAFQQPDEHANRHRVNTALVAAERMDLVQRTRQ